MRPLISVVVPIYNVEKYLNRCIDSIVNQTYKNLEIILVDDGSPDKCAVLCDEWKTKDERIKVIHKKNGGLSDARNAGIDIAKGEYIAFVDSDDYIETGMYETMINEMIKNDCQISCCGRNIVSEGSISQQHTLTTTRVFEREEAIKELLSYGCIEEAAWDKLYLKKLFDDIRFPKGELNEDIAIMPWIINKSNRVVHIGKSFYNYCQNPGTITKSGYSKKLSVCVNHVNQVEEFITKLNFDCDKELCIFKARYGLALITTMLASKGSKKQFPEDYMFYKNILLKNYKFLITSPNFNKSTKARCLFIIWGIYPLAKTIKDIILK